MSHQYHGLAKNTGIVLTHVKDVTGCRIRDLLQLHAPRRSQRTTRTTRGPQSMTIEKISHELELLNLNDDRIETL